MDTCNYSKKGESIHKGTYDVRQEYKTSCGLIVVNLQERVWNGVEAVRIKPNGKCMKCRNKIDVIEV